MCMFQLQYFYPFLFLIVKTNYFCNFVIQNKGQNLHKQAPKWANFYESQWIALKLKNIHKLAEKIM